MGGLVGCNGVPLVLQAPAHERLEHGSEVAPLLGQLVPNLAPAGLLTALDDAVGFELAKPDREPLRRHRRQQPFEVAETTRAGEQVADDQERPAVADPLEGSCGEAEVSIARRHRLT